MFHGFHLMPGKLRVCLISREYPPDTGFGGIATFARHLACGLLEIGHDVTVISLAKEQAKIVNLEGITIHRVEPYVRPSDLGLLGRCIPYSRYVIGTTAAMWQRFLQLHQEKPFDVVDTPELLAEGLFPAITKVAPLAVRLYTPHSKFIAEGLHNVTASFDHQLVALAERVAMLNCDAITSPSRDLAQYVAGDLNYAVEKITIVPNPIDTNEFSPEGATKLPPDGKLKILFVGRLEERKGINYLVQAIPKIVAQFPDVHFFIIGDDTNTAPGQTSVLRELRQFIAASQCGDSITFIDRIPLVELPAYYRSADICVVPSVYDNSPYTCLEAMSCGRAVIGTSGGGTPEYIGDEGAGVIIPPRDVDSLVSALCGLLADEPRRNEMAQRARARVLRCFKRTEIARETSKVYEQAIKEFQTRKPHAAYRRDAQEALADMNSITGAFNMMVHNLLYQESISYRFAYWWHMVRNRPKLMTAKVLLKIAKLCRALGGAGNSFAAKQIEWLEQEIKLKHSASARADEKPSLTSSSNK